jgi:glutamate mutase epsilon subunit
MVLLCSAAWHGVCFVRVLAHVRMLARMCACWRAGVANENVFALAYDIVSVLICLWTYMDTLWGMYMRIILICIVIHRLSTASYTASLTCG